MRASEWLNHLGERDRPGFGSSHLQLDRSIVDWPQDVVALADALGWQRFWLWGGSAGCPYALTCAHELRHRVAGVAIVAGLGPVTDKRVVRKMSVVARSPSPSPTLPHAPSGQFTSRSRLPSPAILA